MLWLAFALLTASSVAALLHPLLRAKAHAAPSRADCDIAVYRSQLRQVEADVERGLLAPDLAEAAGAEIGRRILAADTGEPAPADNRRARIIACLVIALMLPLGAGFLYAGLGSPALPGAPFTWRLRHDPFFARQTEALKLAESLRNAPSAEGYTRLADMFFSLNDYPMAVAAYRRAASLGEVKSASLLARLGEALAMTQGAKVTSDAEAAFTESLKLDSREPRARFYLGLEAAQNNRFKEAVAIWRDLERETNQDAPWLAVLRRNIVATAKLGGFDPSTVDPKPPMFGSAPR